MNKTTIGKEVILGLPHLLMRRLGIYSSFNCGELQPLVRITQDCLTYYLSGENPIRWPTKRDASDEASQSRMRSASWKFEANHTNIQKNSRIHDDYKKAFSERAIRRQLPPLKTRAIL